MRNPFRRRKPAPRTVTVTIEADASGFVEGMYRVREQIAALRYRGRIREERAVGLDYVGEQLDGLCEHFGMDPVEVWRHPQWAEQRERTRTAHRLVWVPEVADPSAPSLAEIAAGQDLTAYLEP